MDLICEDFHEMILTDVNRSVTTFAHFDDHTECAFRVFSRKRGYTTSQFMFLCYSHSRLPSTN